MEKIVAANEEIETVDALVKDLETVLSEVDSLNERYEEIIKNIPELSSQKESELYKQFLSAVDQINAFSAFNKDLFERENIKVSEIAKKLNADSIEFQKEASALLTFISEVK